MRASRYGSAVLVLGDIAIGVTLVGPFDNVALAADYASLHHDGEHWLAMAVEPPEGTRVEVTDEVDGSVEPAGTGGR